MKINFMFYVVPDGNHERTISLGVFQDKDPISAWFKLECKIATGKSSLPKEAETEMIYCVQMDEYKSMGVKTKQAWHEAVLEDTHGENWREILNESASKL